MHPDPSEFDSQNLSPEVLREVDVLCDQFEAAWADQNIPDIDEFVARASTDARAAVRAQLQELRAELIQTAAESGAAAADQTAIKSRTADTEDVTSGEAVTQILAAVDSAATSGSSFLTPETTSIRMAEHLGRYRLERELGQGGMGTVYLAHDTVLDRQIALKIPRFGERGKAELIERFYLEARSMAAIRHPFLCAIHDVGEIDGIHFLSMEYLRGATLSDRLKREAYDADQAVQLLMKLCEAVQLAHDAGVVHRDLKPGNVMITEDGEPVIMDFGLARRDHSGDSQVTEEGLIIGTPAYMAPEQAGKDAVDSIPEAARETFVVGPHSDIYSLGVILYELVLGRPPFTGSALSVLAQLVHEPAKPLVDQDSSIDADLSRVCAMAMNRDPVKRFSSANAFRGALEAWRQIQQPVEDTPSSALKTPFVLVAMLLVALISGGLIYRAFAPPEDINSAASEVSEDVLPVDLWVDGQLATDLSLASPVGLHVDHAGNLFFVDRKLRRIIRVNPDGTIYRVAGGGTDGRWENGDEARDLFLSEPRDVTTDTHGNIYFSDVGYARIAKVAPDGKVTIVAGGGSDEDWDGTESALQLSLGVATGLAIDPQQRLIFSDTPRGRIVRLLDDGGIELVAGGGTDSDWDGSETATDLLLGNPRGMTIDTSGNVYFCDQKHRLTLRVRPTGEMDVVAGGGEDRDWDGTESATEIMVTGATQLFWTEPDELVMSNAVFQRMIRIHLEDGSIDLVAGGGTCVDWQDGFLATDLNLRTVRSPAVGPDGTIYFCSDAEKKICRINPDGTITVVAGGGEIQAVLSVPEVQPGDDSEFRISEHAIVHSGYIRDGAVGDINNDKRPDVVLAGDEGHPTTIWLNNGKAEFGRWNLDLPSAADVQLEDIDNDGDLDLWLLCRPEPDQIFRNDGEGQFALAQTLDFNICTFEVVFADFDQDGDRDAFLANGVHRVVKNRILPNFVLFNDGTGNFADTGQRLGKRFSYAAVAIDLDQDNDLDLCVGNTGKTLNRTLFNDGKGYFTEGQELTYGGLSLVAADVNKDGRPELVIGSGTQVNTVWQVDDEGRLTQDLMTFGGLTCQQVDLCDLNADGFMDVIAANKLREINAPESYPGPNRIWWNDGQGRFPTSSDLPGEEQKTKRILRADFDGDGDHDLVEVALDATECRILINQQVQRRHN